MNNQFKEDILEGLNAQNKYLPSKYFYDEKGDDLFVQIMQLDEYYLTDCELDIFKNKTAEIINQLNIQQDTPFDLIELGAGDGTKTKFLLNRLVKDDFDFTYHPVDISQHALNDLSANLSKTLPSLQVETQQGDYFDILTQFKSSTKQKIVLFLGSNIGNYEDEEAQLFLRNTAQLLNAGDRLLVGTDLIKSKDIVLPAYSDSKGITAAFNLNLLKRINRELQANFQIDQFEHLATYDEEEGIARSYIVSKKEQVVQINGQTTIKFSENERIYTEISRKYNDQIVNRLLTNSGLSIHSKIKDSKSFFADYILVKE